MTQKSRQFPAVLGAAIIACTMTACTSLQSQMSSYDSDIRSHMSAERWNSAKVLIDTAKFDCTPEEQREVDAWRTDEHLKLKNAFSKDLQKTVEKANEYYLKGQIPEGDKVRQSLKDKYYGDQGGAEPAKLLSLSLFNGNSPENRIPECLAPCIELAWVQMLSDRNIARMIAAFNGFQKRIGDIDVNGGKKSIKELDEIAVGFKKVDKWKDKIDLFMEMLAVPETRKWAPLDRSQYAGAIKRMEKVRDEVIKQYKTRRWNTRVIDRKHDYEKIVQLSAAKNYHAAMQMLSSHDLLVKPIGLQGTMEFDDQAERSKVASGDLGEAIVKQIFESGLSGVQYHRRTSNRGMYSMLVVGRVQVEDVTNRRKLREAGRVAQMQARAEFVRFMSTSVSAETETSSIANDDDFHKTYKNITRETAQSEVSDLVVIATGVDGDEVVFILGWRNPDAGTITPAPMHRVPGKENFTVSPSVGAYL